MKINIITQPLFCNYGGILQNYALQEVLRRMGHEVLTVNVPPRDIAPRPDWKAYVHAMINFAKRLRGRYYAPFLNPHTFARKERELSFPQREFVKKHIRKTDEKIPFTSQLCTRYPADAWIVGSDQVWRPWCSPDIVNYFLDFVASTSTRKIAYAASFGTDQWEISPEITERIKPLAQKFAGISVRESSGAELCRKYLGVEARHVLDPTLLLSAADYLSLTDCKDYPDGKYIATYVLDSSPENRQIIKTECASKSLPEIKVGRMHRDRFDSIESWLATIAHADCVVTDSFHGTVFSIIFGRPVKILGNTTRGNARLESLMALLDITPDTDGYCRPDAGTRATLAALQRESIAYLEQALK